MDAGVRNPLIIVGSVLALATLSTIVLSATVGPATYEPGTPEAVVQQFVQGALAGDTDRVLTSIDPDHGCRWVRLDLVSSRSSTARIADVRISDTLATVVVEFSEDDTDPFGSGWSHRETFHLVRSGGTWFVATTTWLSEPCLR